MKVSPAFEASPDDRLIPGERLSSGPHPALWMGKSWEGRDPRQPAP